jgi:hypothetical protein
METVGRGKITGFKWFNGSVEQGGPVYDTGTIFVEAKLKPSQQGQTKNGAKGYAAQPYKCINSAVVKAIQHLEFPITAEISFESVTDGKQDETQVVQSIKPLEPAAAPRKVA